MVAEQRRINWMAALRLRKEEQHLTYKQIEELTIANGDHVSLATIKNVYRDNGIGHKLSTIISIADAMGVDIGQPDAATLAELETLRKSVKDKDEQIESMRKILHKQTKKLTVLVSFIIILLVTLCIALAFDVLQPAVGWIH